MAQTSGQLRKRRDRIEGYLDVWGDLHITDDGAAGDRRRVEFALEAPGQDLPVEVRARYAEYYRRQPSGEWLIAKYHYEYLDIGHGRRLAYHMHDIGSRLLVPHAHCGPATDLDEGESPHHLRAVELDLREAHEQFMVLYAAGMEPDCNAFLPLEVPRAERGWVGARQTLSRRAILDATTSIARPGPLPAYDLHGSQRLVSRR